jgi:hypothetical protein
MSQRLITPFIALGLAFLVWLYTHSRNQEVLDRYQVPVELHLDPAQADLYELEVNGPGQVAVTFMGPSSRIREVRDLLQHGEVRFRRTLRVPEGRLGESHYTENLQLDAAELPLPPGLQAVIPGWRERITVTLRRLVEKPLQVELKHTGGDRIEDVVLEPNTVLVRGPRDVLDRAVSIPTELYLVPHKPHSTETLVKDPADLVPVVTWLGGHRVHVSPAEVSVRFVLRPGEKVHELAKVPVRFLCPAGFPYQTRLARPGDGELTLKVQGPAARQPPAVVAYVDLCARQLGPGRYENEPVQVRLPEGFRLAQEPPRLSWFEVVRPGAVR